MKKLLCILALLISPHLALAAPCEHPAKPSFPDPKTVTPEAAQQLDAKMQKYAAGMNAYVQCLAKEAQTAQEEGKDVINFYNQKFLTEYNKRATPVQ